jgi:hypothetical protein
MNAIFGKISLWWIKLKARFCHPVDKIRRNALVFNHDHAKRLDYTEWMCPNCGKISKGIYHEYTWLSGLKFPACCRRYCWHGWRSFDDFIPSMEADLQPEPDFHA